MNSTIKLNNCRGNDGFETLSYWVDYFKKKKKKSLSMTSVNQAIYGHVWFFCGWEAGIHLTQPPKVDSATSQAGDLSVY